MLIFLLKFYAECETVKYSTPFVSFHLVFIFSLSYFYNGDETFLFIFVRNSKNFQFNVVFVFRIKAILTGESGTKRIWPGIPELVMAPRNA